ncbi:MAG: hypothetical protein M5R36_08940 [Deltaproteobacteria bacterium]|nr:hypothetical protein [Deltaproteobacteria bacterium]
MGDFSGGVRAGEAGLIYLILAAYLIAAAFACVKRSDDSVDADRRAAVTVVVVFGLVACQQIFVKPDFSHILQSAPLAYVVAAGLFAFPVSNDYAGFARWALIAWLFAQPVSLAFCAHATNPYTGSVANRFGRDVVRELGGARVHLTAAEDEEVGGVVDYLRRESAGCPRLFVPTNQPLYYFLTGLADVTGYPAVVFYADDPSKEREVIERLDASPPVYVVFVDDSIEGRERRLENAAPAVYQYLMDRYQPVAAFGQTQILRRNGIGSGRDDCGT